MRHSLLVVTLCTMLTQQGCTASPSLSDKPPSIIGIDSFALASRYGTPAGYQHLGDYLQLNYGGTAAGCQVIVLVDQDQRVAGWASSGPMCSPRAR